jgi:pimeloyl-ACP methyl ester carboxylesterase
VVAIDSVPSPAGDHPQLAEEPRSVQSAATPIYYEVAGAGPPLVLVHGLSASGRWWARNVPALAKCFRVYAVDLLGFGHSRGGRQFVLREAAERLAEWMDALSITRVNLVGHSMGGLITADLAADFPERVDRLVLVAPAAFSPGPDYGRHLIGLLRWLRYAPLSFLPVLLTDAWRAGPITIARAARELLATDVGPKLARVTAPTLIVWGEHDSVVPPEVGGRLQASLPSAKLEVIPGAAHNPMWDQPEVFNRLVLAFLRGA